MDLILFNYLNSLAGKWTWIDILVIFSAEYLGYWLLAGVSTLAIVHRKEYGLKIFLYSLLGAIFSRFIVTEMIRFFYEKTRPFETMEVYQLIYHSSGNGFPSGHASFFFALSTVVFFYNRFWGTIFFGSSIILSLSRVIAGIHWPADILGGTVVGILSGFVVYKLFFGGVTSENL